MPPIMNKTIVASVTDLQSKKSLKKEEPMQSNNDVVDKGFVTALPPH